MEELFQIFMLFGFLFLFLIQFNKIKQIKEKSFYEDLPYFNFNTCQLKSIKVINFS